MRLGAGVIKIRQNITRKDRESWQIITKKGIRSVRYELLFPLVQAVRAAVRFKYLPVGRNVAETISKELSHDLVSTIFKSFAGSVRTRQTINELIRKLIEALEPKLEETGSDLTNAMIDVFQEVKKMRLHLPFSDLESMLQNLIPDLQDSYSTAIEFKGAGLQTSSLIFFLKYLADNHPQRHNSRVSYIWAIEEPESFLHPEKQRSVAKVLEEFSGSVQTFVTTHCPHFVSRQSNSAINVVEKSNSIPYSTFIKSKSFDDARLSLGVSLVDSMFLFPHNIILEGISDETLLRIIWDRLQREGRLKTKSSEIKFLASGNSDRACNNYHMLKTFDSTVDANIILLLDGDDAGRKALNGLQSRLKSQNLGIVANADYFQLEDDIEWLFDAEVMEDLTVKFPSQVRVQYDTGDNITDFEIYEGHKVNIARYVAENSTIDQLKDFEILLSRIDRVLQKK